MYLFLISRVCRSDYLWLVSMLMTSPLVVTLGITLTVKIAPTKTEMVDELTRIRYRSQWLS